MKRLLLLSVCLMLVGAVSAQAGFLALAPTLSEQDGPVTLSAAITSFSSSLDKVVISITGISGGSYVSAFEGVFTDGSTDGLGGFTADGNTFDTITGQGGAGDPQTWMHEAAETGGLSNGNPAYLVDTGNADPGSGFEIYSSFADAWYSSGTATMPRATGTATQKVFATFFVTDATTTSITFGPEGVGPSGSFDSAVGIYLGGTPSEHFTFSAPPTPEPSTLVLLASGLMGLLCYAWRKRK